MRDFYFFLSYARDEDQRLVDRFFNDLSAEIRGFAGLPLRTEVGYLDVHVPMGTRWPDELTRALAVSANFVAFISPRYLRSEPCGREWAAFSERVESLKRIGGNAPSVMMPIIWIPIDDLPQTISVWQYMNQHFPDGYADVGLRQMLRVQRWEQDYLELVPKMARQIVKNTRDRALPPGDGDLDFQALRSAFADKPDEWPRAVTNLHDVILVIVAPSREQAGDVALFSKGSPFTRDLQFYGEDPLAWAPFRPAFETPIALFASQIASEHGFNALVTDTNGAGEMLRKARDEANMPCSILIVDPWTAHITECRQALQDLRAAAADAPIAAVLVPAGHGDRNTRAHIDELAGAIRLILMNGSWRQLTYRPDIMSADGFDADFQVVLEGCRSRAIKLASRTRRPGRASNRPILNGP